MTDVRMEGTDNAIPVQWEDNGMVLMSEWVSVTALVLPEVVFT